MGTQNPYTFSPKENSGVNLCLCTWVRVRVCTRACVCLWQSENHKSQFAKKRCRDSSRRINILNVSKCKWEQRKKQQAKAALTVHLTLFLAYFSSLSHSSFTNSTRNRRLNETKEKKREKNRRADDARIFGRRNHVLR